MTALKVIALIALAVGIYFLCRGILFLFSRQGSRMYKSQWMQYLSKRNLGKRCLLAVPGIVLYFLLYAVLERGSAALIWMHKIDLIYLIIVFLIISNSIMLTFLDLYSHTDKNKTHPLKGLIQGLQVVLFFVGAIIVIAILLDKSPTALLTGLGASAAVLMLVFKDSILGFVSGVQLAQNNMIRIGDWIQMPDGSANGTVEEITLNTVKVRNWDNTISTIPPYTLISSTFKNWRGMAESGGRRADKRIFIDLRSIEFCTEEMIKDICKSVPLMADYNPSQNDGGTPAEQTVMPTNAQLYRVYIERYLRQNPLVAQSLDIIVAQREPTQFGVPIEVYFFLSDKTWAPFERKQSDIFDHLLAMTSAFGLRLYQLPMQTE